MEIRKVGNLYQLHGDFGTVYQSHNIEEVKEWARCKKLLYTIGFLQKRKSYGQR